MKMRSPVILVAALAAVIAALLALKHFSGKESGMAENSFTAGERIEIPHEGHGHDVHVSPPAVAVDGDGRVFVAWIAQEDRVNNLYVIEAGKEGAKPVRVNPEGAAVDSLHQAPGIAVGPGGVIYVSWSAAKEKPEGVLFACDLRLSKSLDHGSTFDEGVTINEDRPISHTFEGMAVDGEGDVLVSWIDSRDGWDKPATYFARISGQGTEVGDEVKLGDNTCVCCRVDVAAGPGGEEVAFWRGVSADNIRDMVLALGKDGGEFESAVVHNDGWRIEACPHRGGEVAIGDDGEVYVLWYTEGRQGVPEILFSKSKNVNMPAPERLDSSQSSIPDMPGLAVSGDSVAVTWEDSTAVRRNILVRFSGDGGKTFGEPVVISKAIKSFMPDITTAPDGRFVTVWHEEHFPSIRTIVQYLEPSAK